MPDVFFLRNDLSRSHGSHDEKAVLVDLIRELEVKHGKPIAVLADLQVQRRQCFGFSLAPTTDWFHLCILMIPFDIP